MCFGRKEEKKHRALSMGKKKSNLVQHATGERRASVLNQDYKERGLLDLFYRYRVYFYMIIKVG